VGEAVKVLYLADPRIYRPQAEFLVVPAEVMEVSKRKGATSRYVKGARPGDRFALKPPTRIGTSRRPRTEGDLHLRFNDDHEIIAAEAVVNDAL
jgi:hypothetical protein